MQMVLKGKELNKKLNTNRRALFFLLIIIGVACLLAYFPFFTGQKLYLFDLYDNDTKTSYLMQYSNFANKIFEGDWTSFDFNFGSGFNIFIAQANLFDPFLWIVILFAKIGGIAAIPYSLFYMILAKIFCAGISCYYFLSAFQFTEKAKVLTAFVYSLCGFMTCWSPHYFLVTPLVFFPLILMCLEMSFRNKNYLLGFLVLIAAMLCISVYQSFAIILFVICFGIARFIMITPKITWTLVKEQLLPIVAAGIIGVLVSAIVLLPTAHALLMGSDRLASDSNLWEKLNAFTIQDFYSRFGLRPLGQIFSVNYGFPGASTPIFFSSLFAVLVPQYIALLFTREKNKRIKVVKIIAVVFAVCFILTPYLETISNAFNLIKGSLRFTYLLMPLFAIVMAHMLTVVLRDKYLNRPVLWGTISAFLVFLWCILFDEAYWAREVSLSNKLSVVIGVVMSIVFAIVLLLVTKTTDKRGYRIWCVFLAVMLLGNMSVDAWILMRNRAVNTPDQLTELYDEGALQAAKHIKETEKEFYRTEKVNYSVSQYGEAGVTNFNGLSIYNSLPNQYLGEYYRKLWPAMLIKNDVVQQTYVYNPLNNNEMESLLNLKYIITNKEDFDPVVYQVAQNFGDYLLLENPNAQPLGIFYNNVVDERTFENLTPMQQRMILYKAMLVNDPQNEDLTYSSYNSLGTEETIENSQNLNETLQYVPENSTKQEPLDNHQISKAFSIPLIGEATSGIATFALDRAVYLGSVPGDLYLLLDVDIKAIEGKEQEVTDEQTEYWLNVYFDCGEGYQFHTEVRYPLKGGKSNSLIVNIPHNAQSMMFEFAGLDWELQPVNSVISEMEITNMNLITPGNLSFPTTGEATFEATTKSDHIEGSVEAQSDGYLMISIPYSQGWKIFVDGQQTSIFRADYGFMGIKVPEGIHTISMYYDSPLFKEGFYLSLIGIGLTVAFYFGYIKRRYKKSMDVKE